MASSPVIKITTQPVQDYDNNVSNDFCGSRGSVLKLKKKKKPLKKKNVTQRESKMWADKMLLVVLVDL